MSVVVIRLACEDAGHYTMVTRLVDDQLLEHHDWLDGILKSCRSYHGLIDGQPWYKYDPNDANDIRPIVIDGVRIGPHGHIGGEPLKPEAGMWRNVLLLFARSEPQPEVVVLCRDMDGYPERREGMKQARDHFRWPFQVAIATADPEVEAWRVCGFSPETRAERDRLAALRSELSFDPTTQSELLTSHPNDAPTDAKLVLDRLCDRDEQRSDACLADRTRLRQRGRLNGVEAFLDELDERVVPVFGARR